MEKVQLNQNQNQAVEHLAGAMMVLAGPGSGKTTVITHRIQRLVAFHHIAPSDITVITFTKLASLEMKKRYERLAANLGGKPEAGSPGVYFGTFHAFFFQILRQSLSYTVADILADDQRKMLLRDFAQQVGVLPEDDADDFLQKLSNEISLVKSELMDIENYHAISMGARDFISVFKLYEQWKAAHRKIDFDDMLVRCHHLLATNEAVLNHWRTRCKFILIDEFQDINRAQYETIKLLTNPLCNIFVVGDDDQSIYKFRGAKPEFLLRFPQDFTDTKQIVLNINYRSTHEIITVCNEIIAGNTGRYVKDIQSDDKKGTKPKLITSEDVAAEAAKIGRLIKKMDRKAKGTDFSDIAVIYRTNMQGRAFADAFIDLHIPFQMKDETPNIYNHWVCKDVCAYLRLSYHYNDEDAARVINKPSRYVQKGIIAAGQKSESGLGLLTHLLDEAALPAWQLAKVEELAFHLEVIKRRTTFEAVKVIRQAAGYQTYLREYAAYRKIGADGLFEVLNEIQEAAKRFPDKQDFVTHALNMAEQSVEHKNSNGVVLTTMHSAKGLEFEAVFVAGCVEGVVPHEKSKTPSQIEEERRLLYVAMTRAKSLLTISVYKSRYEQAVKPSRFLKKQSKAL